MSAIYAPLTGSSTDAILYVDDGESVSIGIADVQRAFAIVDARLQILESAADQSFIAKGMYAP